MKVHQERHLNRSAECSSEPAASLDCAWRGSPQTCKRWKQGDKGVEPEVGGVGVPADREEAEVLQPYPGDRSVAKVAHSAVQTRQVARHHCHVERAAATKGSLIKKIKYIFIPKVLTDKTYIALLILF